MAATEPIKIDYLAQPLKIVEGIARDLFEKHRYPPVVRMTLYVRRSSETKAIIGVTISNDDRWLRYRIEVEVDPPYDPFIKTYPVRFKATLGESHELYVHHDKIETKEVEYAAVSNMVGYYFKREIGKILLYWQAIIQMSWIDLSLFQLVHYKVDHVLHKLGIRV